jgi:AmmeMemoRadiSam system protein A
MIMGLSSFEKGVLLDLARSTVTAFIQQGLVGEHAIDTAVLPKSLLEKKGLFVTIYKLGELRGCMGTILPVMSIWEACRENARSAAYKDPRFVPLASHELDQISFEITTVDKPRPIPDISLPEKGIHGLILTKGFRKEVFLPGSLEDLPRGIEEILAALRAKADMNDDDRDAPEEWELFDADVISEVEVCPGLTGFKKKIKK